MTGNVNQNLGIHYGSISLFISMLHNLFLLYHVEMFVSVYKIDKFSFWVGETLFLIWNSCNDPLFGWISDKRYLFKSIDGSHVVLGRLKALAWNGPLFAVSFLAFWIAWTYPSLQFVVCLCAYDGFLTMIDLHHSALLADLSVRADVRTKLNMYCSLFSGIGSFSVFLSYLVWSRDSLVPFQTFCFVLAGVAIVGFIGSTSALSKMYQKAGDGRLSPHLANSDKEPELQEEKAALKKFIYGLSRHKNLVWFTVMNLVQVFHCHFNSNFFPLFLDNLIGDEIPQYMCSLILGVSFIAPHVNNLYFLTLCRKYGAYKVIRLLFWIKLVLSCCMLLARPGQIWILSLFIASNRVFTEGTCKLLNLVISDLVDEDVVLNDRKQAVSALMFGTVAFLSKPGQTLAPLIGTLLLALGTGHDVFETGNETGSIKLRIADMTSENRTMYQLGIFHLLVYIPIVCAVIQLVAWSKFNLHGIKLDQIKYIRTGLRMSAV